MAALPHATGIAELLREFNKSDNHLCSSCLQPMDSDDVPYDNSSLFNLTTSEDENVHYHLSIVNRLCTSFRFGSPEEQCDGREERERRRRR
ncbi:unnamed protein product [Hymenolepis diminuta]|uniref:Uncharacterized protein n=1 Tax=Hymenolepis diminuta TaxID=6216 RepID=A0A564YYB3_HYMDI|nr:unnamed protein product [Hymenolepis diminuta]